jgi:hypothetical protein
MSAYECFESFAAIDEMLRLAGDALPAPLKLLALEYRRFTLDRAQYFYPDALPLEAVAKDKIRNGHIDRRLSFPLEDIYGDGQPAGQVGQEIYGCGGAFIFAARAFHERRGAPLRIFTEFPSTIELLESGKLAVRPLSASRVLGRVLIFRKGRSQMPRLAVRRESPGKAVPPRSFAGHREYDCMFANGIMISWAHEAGKK